jgi:membrane protein implicated in regulation of membrane protease activity
MNLGAAGLAALAGPVLALGGFLAVNVMAFIVLVVLAAIGLRAVFKGRAPGPGHQAPVAAGRATSVSS